MSTSLSRRTFIIRLIQSLAAFVAMPHWAKGLLEAKTTNSLKYRALGKTGYRISEIGFGGYPIRDPAVLDHAIDLGINYIDTASDYRGGKSEEAIGHVMKRRRKEVVLTTKWHPWSFTKKEEMLKSLEESLKRLQTDYVDLIKVHQVGKSSGPRGRFRDTEGIGRLENPELFEAFEIAKKRGMVKYLGASGHDGDLMEVMNYALDTGNFDAILCRYNFLDYPEQKVLFERAKSLGVGVAVMKTLAGARDADITSFKTPQSTFAQTALRWVLSNPNVSVAVISMRRKSQVDEYVTASGFEIRGEERKMLERYAALHSPDWCRMCNKCESTCPQELPIAAILRYNMYAHSMKELDLARDAYSEFADRQLGQCGNCKALCLASCPWDVPIQKKMLEAHQTLSRLV